MRFAGVKPRAPRSTRNPQQQKQHRMEEAVQLLTAPMSIDELALVMSIPRATVRTYVEDLYFMRRLHIAEWRRNKTRYFPAYMAGDKADAPPPEVKEEEVFKRPPVAVNMHRDPLVAALFGGALEKVREAA